MNKRVKIVATLGPAVEIRGGKKFGEEGYWGEKLDRDASAKNIAQLIKEGANVFRFNFSHGNHAEQGERMEVVRQAEELAGQKVGFLLDTKGPEIRTELFEGDAKEYSYKTGEQIRVATKQGIKSTREVIALNVAGGLDIFDDVEVGKQVLVDDGKLGLRVDMGIEVPFEMVPVYQKMIITKVNAAGKIAVTATNMLETMTDKPRATRSEVSDVFNAVIDGTDATMLSGESANGKYPVESVRTMATIDKNAQTLLKEYGRLDSSTFGRSSKTEVVASAVKDATNSIDIKLVVALTESGNTARLISKYRPEADILAVTFDEITQKSLMLNWGVIPVVTEKPASTDDMFDVAEKVALHSGLVESGDNIVIVAGVPVGTGGTNTMRIRTVK